MSARREDLPRLRRRFTRRRLFVYSALGLIGLVIIAVLIAFLYLRSERFNRYLAIEIEKALEAYGLRAEVGVGEPEFGSGAITLRNLKLFNRQTGQPIATISRARASLTIRDPFALRLRREIVFDRLELDGIDLWVVFDEQGRSNFQGLRRPPPLHRRITFDYSRLVSSLNKVAVHLIDRERGLRGDLRDLTGEGRPIEGAAPPKVGARLTSGKGSLVRDGHEMAIESVEFIGRVTESGAEIERLAMRSPVAEATVSGRLDDWRSPRYRLDTQAWARLDETLALFAPKLSLKGAASFNGRIEGEGAQWSASGQAASGELAAYGVTFRGAQADRARLDSRDGKWTFSIGQARARSVAAEGVELTTATASDVKGTIAKGQARITSDRATVASIKIGKAGRNELREVTLRNVSATYESGKGKGEWTFSSSLAQARSGVAGDIQFTDASTSKPSGTLIDGQAQFTSDQASVQQIKIGRLKAGQSEFNDVTARDLNTEFGLAVSTDVSKGQWTFSIGQAQARSGVAGGTELTNASASNVKGMVVDGRAQITSDQATVERARAGQNDFNEVASRDLKTAFSLDIGKREWTFSIGQTQARSGVAEGVKFTAASASNVSGTVTDGRAQITSGQAAFEHAEVSQGAFNGITLRDVAATLESGANEARGLISLRDGNWDKIKFGQTTGRFAANSDAISLSGFDTSALGGGATGDLIVEFAPDSASKLRADFTGLQTVELFALFGAPQRQLAGAVTGRVDVTWPGTNLRLISGDISARFDGQTTSTPDAIPVSGEIVARAQSGVFSFDRFTLRTDASTLTATGRLALDGDSDLRFSLTSTRAEELLTILSSPGLVGGEIGRLMTTYEPHLFGDFSFTGTLAGRLDNPTIAGDLQASSFGLRDEILGAVRGRVLVSPSEFRFEHGSLTTDTATGTGGSAKFNYVAPRDAAASTGKFDITFERVNLDSLLGSLGIPTQQKLVTGEVSGEARLTGLPAAPQGAINLNLVNGVIAGQRAESATAVIRFDAQTARIERVEARFPQGHFTASGVINLETNEYQFQGETRQLGLQRIAEAFELGATRLGGVADATFQVSGDFDDPGVFRIEMTAQARQVTIDGRASGPVTLTARTAADGRIDVEMTTEVAGRRQPITASIEWRRPGRPITITADLMDFDIAPFLSVYAPDIAQSVSVRVTGTLRVAGPTVGAQGEATLVGLRGALTLTAVALQIDGTPVDVSTPLDVAIGDSQLRIASARITARGADLRIGGSFALTENAPIDFSITGRVDLGEFRRPEDYLILDGEVMVDARISGSISDPNVAGAATLRDISVSTPDAPITLEGGSGRVVLSGARLTVENFTARAGGGSAQISGGATLTALRPTEWRFDITAKEAEALWRGVRAAIDANLTLTGTPQGQTLSGRVTIPAAEYTSSELSLVELGEQGRLRFSAFGGTRSEARGLSLAPINLDVAVEARESFLIRGNQVNTIASATLRLTGPLADPEFSGRVTFEGGAAIFRGRRYEITSGSLELPGGYEEPRLQLQAEGNIRGYRVIIGFSGPIDSLDLSLNSEPRLSRPEIISLITTGSVGSSALNAPDPARAGLTTAGALLSDEFISKTLGRETERFLGLNRFQIDPVLRPYDNPAARVTIGRQLARGLSFFYSTNLASEQEQTGLLEYDITNRFSVVTTYTQSGDTQVRAIDPNEFTIDIRGRKRFSLGAGRGATTGPAPGGVKPNLGPNLGPNLRPNFGRLAIPPGNLKVGVTPSDGREIKLSEDRLRELLPVREGFSRAQLRLGERNLTNYLQEKGYLFAQVQGRCDPADCKAPSINDLRVFYDVQPGRRYDLKEIHIISAVGGAEELDEHELKADLQSKDGNLLGEFPVLRNLPVLGGETHGKTSNDRMRADRETIRAAMANLGYRSARVESRLCFTTNRDELALIFVVEKGPKSIVRNVVVRGNTLFAASELRELAPINSGEPFSAESAREGARKIKNFYTERGYLEARTDVNILDLPGDCVSLIYEVTEGVRAVACGVEVTGQTITRAGSVRRFSDFEPGDVLTPRLLREAERDLYATGAFREVIVRATPDAGAARDARLVTVSVAEADPLSLYYALGYSTDDGPRATVQFTNTNLFGRLILGSLRLRGSQEEQLAQVQLADLRPWGKKWPTTFSAFYQRDSDVRPFVRRRLVNGNVEPRSRGQSFGINRFVGFIQTQRKLTDRTLIRFRYSLENVKLFNLENIPVIEVTRNERSLRLGEFSTGITRETRDNVLSPTRGQLFSFDHSLAASALGGNESFNKFFAEYQRYDTPRALRGTTIAIAARLGLAGLYRVADRDSDGVISEPERRLPISERFFAGGATTLRGFRFEEAGPQGILEPRNSNELPTLVPIGGDALVIFNFELRFPLSRRWRLVPFYDLGNVFRRVSDISFAGMTNSVGLGLRFNTPIGPVGVDYGYLLDPPFFITASGATLRQPRSAFHIRIGQSF
jgi:outer membrane protein insertion porin family